MNEYPRKPEAGPANTKGAALLGYVIWYGLRGENMKHRIDDWGLDPSDFREINLGFDAEVVSADNKQVHIRYNDKLDSLLYAHEEDEPHDLL